MSGTQAVTKIRLLFREVGTPMRLANIKAKLPELETSSISMSLCYFIKQRYATRELVPNICEKQRKNVWLYTYYDKRLPAPTASTTGLTEGVITINCHKHA
jgi:hypothetical protein